MGSAWEAVRNCGWTAYIAILLGMMGLVVGVVALVVALLAKGKAGIFVGFVAAFLGFSCLAIGAAGMMNGRRNTDSVIASEALSLDTETRVRIHEAGYSEASQCVTVGSVNAGLPLLLGSLAIFIAFMRRRSAAPVT